MHFLFATFKDSMNASMERLGLSTSKKVKNNYVTSSDVTDICWSLDTS